VKGLGKDASNEQKAATVTRIIDEKASAGQFDDCNFSPSDRRKAAHFFLDVLETNDHERVKNYPHGN
jgi:membrane-associated HD superfamily phosphohydrolase